MPLSCRVIYHADCYYAVFDAFAADVLPEIYAASAVIVTDATFTLLRVIITPPPLLLMFIFVYAEPPRRAASGRRLLIR